MFFDPHHIVEHPLNRPVSRAVEATNIEVDDLDYVPMSGLKTHADLIEENVKEALLMVGAAGVLLDALVHDFNSHTLVGSEVDA